MASLLERHVCFDPFHPVIFFKINKCTIQFLSRNIALSLLNQHDRKSLGMVFVLWHFLVASLDPAQQIDGKGKKDKVQQFEVGNNHRNCFRVKSVADVGGA
jgi:hypothetical protein